MEFTAKEIAQILNGTVDGNPEVRISTFARIENGKPGSICFFANPKYEQYVYTSAASIILVNNSFEPKEPVAATMVRVENAYSAVAELLNYVTARKRSFKRHRGCRARWHLSTKFGKKVYFGDFAYAGKRSTIGSYTKVYEQVFIGDDVKIGSHCILYPGVRIYPGTVIGDRVVIHANSVIGSDGFGFAPQTDGTYMKIEHNGNVIIEDDVEIGACTTIDKSQMESTIIRKGVKIDNLCQIAHNVEVGENTVMAAMTGVAGSTKIGRHCMFGGQTGIAGHITIADDTKTGAQTGITSSVRQEGSTMFGSPAMPYSDFMRSYVVFRRNGRSK